MSKGDIEGRLARIEKMILDLYSLFLNPRAENSSADCQLEKQSRPYDPKLYQSALNEARKGNAKALYRYLKKYAPRPDGLKEKA